MPPRNFSPGLLQSQSIRRGSSRKAATRSAQRQFGSRIPSGTKIQSCCHSVRSAAGRNFGSPGPADRNAAEVLSKYVIVDMYAKAVQGMPAEDAVKWAAGEVEKIHA